ncbi:Alpha/beta hydrolase fold-3 domain protein [Parafrankia sp. EAN1pec]|nr:Alpha/beta hydrolase fold-3 domain protein [Frankia sp. EAN1pec]
MKKNPMVNRALEDFSSESLARARGPVGFPVTREMASVSDEDADGVPVRIYQPEAKRTGLVVYFHGGGWCVGSVGLMDNVARELAHATGATVVSVEYRLAPEHPYPAGLDDCELVTRWALKNAKRFGTSPAQVVVAGESAGGNLAAAVTLRLRGSSAVPLAGQILIYPGLDSGVDPLPSRVEFINVMGGASMMTYYWDAYAAGRDLTRDPFVVPLQADSLAGLPPALILRGGCDFLRDEGLRYATRLSEAGVPVEDTCYPGQPHGFVNYMFPAAEKLFRQISQWSKRIFAEAN